MGFSKPHEAESSKGILGIKGIFSIFSIKG